MLLKRPERGRFAEVAATHAGAIAEVEDQVGRGHILVNVDEVNGLGAACRIPARRAGRVRRPALS